MIDIIMYILMKPPAVKLTISFGYKFSMELVDISDIIR